MRKYTALLCAVIALASISGQEALIWRHIYGWQVKNPANLSFALDRASNWPKLAPASCGVLSNFASITDISNNLPGPNTSAAYFQPNIAGFIEFATLDGIACYFAWLRPRSDYATMVPLLGTAARMQQVADDTTPNSTYIWLSISRFPTLACGTANYTAPSATVGLAVANMYNISQLAPIGPESGEISADLGLGAILYPDLPPNWNWGSYLGFNTSANMTGFLRHLSTQPAYLTVVNASQNVMSFSFQVRYNRTA